MGLGNPLLEIVVAILLGLLANELFAVSSWAAELLRRFAVSILPAARKERMDQEWQADLHAAPGNLWKLGLAIEFLISACRWQFELSIIGICVKQRSTAPLALQLAMAVLPQDMRVRYEEEWRAHVLETQGWLAKQLTAWGFYVAATQMKHRRPPR